MANITELLAKSLDVLKEIQKDDDFMVVKSSDLSPVHLKRLVANNFLYPIIKGWYVVTDPRTLHEILLHGMLPFGISSQGILTKDMGMSGACRQNNHWPFIQAPLRCLYKH